MKRILFIICVFFAHNLTAQKISELPTTTSNLGFVPIVQDGVSKKILSENLITPEILTQRISTGVHTAFGTSFILDGVIWIALSEGVTHALTVGTKPVIYKSKDNGVTYEKSYIPNLNPMLDAIMGAGYSGNMDARNLAGGITKSGVIYISFTVYPSALEVNAQTFIAKSTDKGVTYSIIKVTITDTQFGKPTGYGKLIEGTGFIAFPSYSEGSGGEAVAIFNKSNDNGATWAQSVIYKGNTTTNYITETDIQQVSGDTIIAIGRRELINPILSISYNNGVTWNYAGIITSGKTDLFHAPDIYSEGGFMYCNFSDRRTNTVSQLKVQIAQATQLAAWNASKKLIITGSTVQVAGAYNFGYTSTIGTGKNRKLVWYDISLSEDVPASLDNATTDILITPMMSQPSFVGRISNTSLTASGVEDTIRFEPNLVDVDNTGSMDYQKGVYTVPEDGLYNILGNLRAGVLDYNSNNNITMYLKYPSPSPVVANAIFQAFTNGRGPGGFSIAAVRHLRKGSKIYFMFYSGSPGPLAVENDAQSTFSIIKIN